MFTQNIEELVKDKSVLFVGNSVEILDYELAEYIESFDIIVRFGKAIIRDEKQLKSLGYRTDIWITGAFRAMCYFEWKDWENISAILFNKCRINLKANIEEPIPIPVHDYAVNMFTDKELQDIFDEFNCTNSDRYDWRPSAGFISILYFMRKVKTYKSLNLIGFDFFAKSTTKRRGSSKCDPHSWHQPIYTIDKSSHNSEFEQSYVQNLHDTNQLNWKILSDLTKEKIDGVKYGRY